MPIRTRVEGSESLQRKLRALGQSIVARNLERAAVAGALIVQNDAKRRAPYKTGNLRRSIHIGGHGDKAGDFQSTTGSGIEGPVNTGTRCEVLVGTNVEYAAQREFGGTISPVNAQMLSWVDASGTRHFARQVTQQATPYLRPALDENEDAVRREMGEAFRALIRIAVP